MKNIFWDLDGTLTDSSEGITKCATLALDHFGIKDYETTDLYTFIGPPLRDSFRRFGIPEEDIPEAIRVFRGRYTVVGKFENHPFEGIPQLLKQLKEEGCRHYLATSKPEETAIQIMDKFELSQYFEVMCGASLDLGRESKDAVIRYLLDKIGTGQQAVMVGDTAFDVTGAAVFKIPTIGVSWGFGDTDEMRSAGAIAIVDTMQELHDAILNS